MNKSKEHQIIPPDNRPPGWQRKAVGGLWEEMGKLQFDFLKDQGLKPEHYMLDVGCGCLRGGVHFICYLELRHYFGVDINSELLEAGKSELMKSDLLAKKPVLVNNGDFDFKPFGRKFDFALAQSVFTHLPLNNIIKCLMNIEKALLPGGRFYATFLENIKGKFDLSPVSHHRADGPDFNTFFDKDPFHYDFDVFEWICKGSTLKAECLGEWGHPRDQKMMVFKKQP